jgi:acetyltransferase-like isoleucine patch superfamily enzyme
MQNSRDRLNQLWRYTLQDIVRFDFYGVYRMELDCSATKFFTVGSSEIRIGRFTYGFENISVIQYGEGASLTVGSFCSIAAKTIIFLGGNHRTDWITTFPFGHLFVEQLGGVDIKGHPATKGDVIIGNDVWVGYNSTVMSGISIGDGAVIAANSHVVKNVRPYSIVGGNPAEEIKFRFEPEICRLLLDLSWWNLPEEDIKSITSELSQCPNTKMLKALLKRFRNR